jgi:hypothetical protein
MSILQPLHKRMMQVARAIKGIVAKCDMCNHPVTYKGEIQEGEKTVFIFRCDCGKVEVRVPYEEKL